MTANLTITISGLPGRLVPSVETSDGSVTFGLSPADPSPVALPGVPRIGLSAPASVYKTWHDDRLPGADFGRVFAGPGDGLPTWSSLAMKGLTARGINVWASAKDRASAMAYIHLFDGIPDGIELTFTHHHEPIADSIDQRAYLAEYKVIREIADEHPNRDRIHIFPILEAHAMRFKNLDWRAFTAVAGTGERYGDGLAFDSYWREDLDYEAPESLIGMPVLAAQEFGYDRWRIAELGATTTRKGRPAWFGEVVEAAAAHGCEAIGLWCSRKTIKVKGKPVELEYRPVDEATLVAYRDLLHLNAPPGASR